MFSTSEEKHQVTIVYSRKLESKIVFFWRSSYTEGLAYQKQFEIPYFCGFQSGNMELFENLGFGKATTNSLVQSCLGDTYLHTQPYLPGCVCVCTHIPPHTHTTTADILKYVNISYSVYLRFVKY